MASIAKKVPSIAVCKMNKQTWNPLMRLSIEFQLARIMIGVRNVVRITSHKEIPSMPRKY
ncbi:hypothetical protein D3C87_1888610 [compost metagenome]